MVTVVVAVVGRGVGCRILLIAITVAGALLPINPHFIHQLHVRIELLLQHSRFSSSAAAN